MLNLRQKGVLSIVALIGILVILISCGNAEPKGTLINETYVVQPGDTLWSISKTFMAKNTAGQRDIREFYHGIIELNYDSVFANRPNNGLIYPGDKLQINYWQL